MSHENRNATDRQLADRQVVEQLPEDGSDRGVIDRFEGSLAVLVLTGPDEQRQVERSQLPSEVAEGDVVFVTRADGRVTVIGIDRATTDARQRDAERRLKRLRQTRSSGRFDR